MAIDFPSTPDVGEIYYYRGQSFQYDGSKWVIAGDKARKILSLSIIPGGRLTPISGDPTEDGSTGNTYTTVYYTPYVHDTVPIWDGSRWVPRQFSQLSLPLDSNSGHTGYHQGNKNFDLYITTLASGALGLVSSPAWSSDTVRSASLTRVNGYLTNASQITTRFDTTTSTLTMAAGAGLYVGTLRTGATAAQYFLWWGGAASGGSNAALCLWNNYHRRPISVQVIDSGASFTYQGTTQAYRNSTQMRINYVTGLAEDAFLAQAYVRMDLPNGVSGFGAAGLGLDSTTGTAGTQPGMYLITNDSASNAQTFLWGAKYVFGGIPALFTGFHYISLNHGGNGSGVVTWNAAGPAAIIAAILM